MAKVFLGLGTNLGDKRNNLLTAVNHIEEKIGKVTSLSSFYETEPWRMESENWFVNAVIQISTTLSPETLLDECQRIERQLGRMNTAEKHTYSDRTIDIDIDVDIAADVIVMLDL